MQVVFTVTLPVIDNLCMIPQASNDCRTGSDQDQTPSPSERDCSTSTVSELDLPRALSPRRHNSDNDLIECSSGVELHGSYMAALLLGAVSGVRLLSISQRNRPTRPCPTVLRRARERAGLAALPRDFDSPGAVGCLCLGFISQNQRITSSSPFAPFCRRVIAEPLVVLRSKIKRAEMCLPLPPWGRQAVLVRDGFVVTPKMRLRHKSGGGDWPAILLPEVSYRSPPEKAHESVGSGRLV